MSNKLAKMTYKPQ